MATDTTAAPSLDATPDVPSSAPITSEQPPPPVPDKRRMALLRFAVSISVLTIIGHLFLGFEQAPITPIACLLAAYATAVLLEFIDARATNRQAEYAGGDKNLLYFMLPAHIAALACAMLIYADNVTPYIFATVVAVASKYVFRVSCKGRLRHYLNPSNFGIALTLLLMPTVGFVPPYHFINNTDGFLDWAIPLGVLMLGTMLNAKLTLKMPLILGWVGGYVLQAVVRSVFFDDALLGTLGMMTGVAFVLYTNYMITDPGTTPFKASRQVLFGISVAMVYGLLIVLQVAFAIFFALTIVCAIRGLGLALIDYRSRRAEVSP